MKDLRLLISPVCDRSCEGCCNKDWDLDGLEEISFNDFKKYKTVMLTGGEPMLFPKTVMQLSETINFYNPDCYVYLYTANTTSPAWNKVIEYLDGVTLTIHGQEDVAAFVDFDRKYQFHFEMSLRLNVFDGITIPETFNNNWKLKTGIQWIKDCPLPENEDFRRL